jgi:tRNA wybutosine-synthesizing protein 1
LKPFLTESYKGAMTKQNYKTVLSHSAVKTCRWMLNSLRNRGGCYKHTFYGISSHECMEATPAVACANKCTFCWRQNSHPVSVSWKPYQVDPPEDVFNGMIKSHRELVKQLKGVPGVDPLKFEHAMSSMPKHAALSLVGEPVFYPHINGLVDLLHHNKISTFLVTNGQFPDQLRKLKNITQLYLSVDASNPKDLKALDRPLFVDYWERLLESMEILRQRQHSQRTVCRLTLIKGKNMDHAAEFSELLVKAKPGFIELKGVTFAAWDKATTGLTMDDNVPWFNEVLEFGEKMKIPGYEIASVHEHSCSVLLARTDLYKPGNLWKKWIDFDKFEPEMRIEDFMTETPKWATYGIIKDGFDPEHKKHKSKSIKY